MSRAILIVEHDAAAELETLAEELRDAKRRLRSHGKRARPEIERQIREIKRDIERNTAILRDRAQNEQTKTCKI